MNQINLTVTLILSICISCVRSKEEDKSLNNAAIYNDAQNNAVVGYSSRAADKGKELSELDDYLDDEMIDKVSESLLANPDITQTELNDAVTLLHRMKKEDYQKTYLLYLNKKLIRAKEQGKEYSTIRSINGRIRYHNILFQYAQPYQESYLRLPEQVRKELKEKAQNELRQTYLTEENLKKSKNE